MELSLSQGFAGPGIGVGVRKGKTWWRKFSFLFGASESIINKYFLRYKAICFP